MTNQRYELRRDGIQIIKSLIAPNECLVFKELCETIWQEAAKADEVTNEAPLGYQNSIKNDHIINCAPFYNDAFVKLLAHPKLIEVIQPELNDPFYRLIPENNPNFIAAQANLRRSDSQLPWHVDTRLATPGPKTWSMQAIIAFEDRCRSNGGLKFVPGSHNSDFFPSPDGYADGDRRVQSLDLSAGDAVVFSSQLHHSTHPPKEGQSAWAYLLTYRCWWVKPQYEFHKILGKKRLENLTQIERTLLGEYSQPNSSRFGSPSARQGYSKDI